MRDAVRTIERSIVHYGETAAKLIDKMLRYGQALRPCGVRAGDDPARLKSQRSRRAAGRDQARRRHLRRRLSADRARRSVGERRRSSCGAGFRRWLVPKITAKNAAASDFDLRRPTGLAELEPPEPEVLAAIQRRVARGPQAGQHRPRRGHVVVDGRGGAPGGRQAGLLSFLRELSPEDRVALVTSGDAIEPNVRLGVPSESRAAVSRAVRDLFPNGHAPVYPAVSRALERCARSTIGTGSTRSWCSPTAPGQQRRAQGAATHDRRRSRSPRARASASSPSPTARPGRQAHSSNRLGLGRRVLLRSARRHQDSTGDLVLFLSAP